MQHSSDFLASSIFGGLNCYKKRALAEQAKWPYQWVNEPLYPLNRTEVSGQLKLEGRGTPAGAGRACGCLCAGRSQQVGSEGLLSSLMEVRISETQGRWRDEVSERR